MLSIGLVRVRNSEAQMSNEPIPRGRERLPTLCSRGSPDYGTFQVHVEH